MEFFQNSTMTREPDPLKRMSIDSIGDDLGASKIHILMRNDYPVNIFIPNLIRKHHFNPQTCYLQGV